MSMAAAAAISYRYAVDRRSMRDINAVRVWFGNRADAPRWMGL